jgi:hypothetical protein
MNTQNLSEKQIERIAKTDFELFSKLYREDKYSVGTKHYIGLAYFWSYEYRHALRDCSNKKRKQVHNAFLRAGLNPSGDSEEHTEIIRKYFPNFGY